MSDTVGQKMSDYPLLSTLTQEERETYMQNVAMTTFGTKDNTGTKINVNVPLSAIVPTVPVTDVTVGGNSVLNNGVAAVPAIPTVPVTDVMVDGTSVLNNGVAEITMPSVPTASSLAGTGLTVNAETNKVDVWLDNSTIGIIGSGGAAGKIEVKNPVPSVGNGHANVGKVLTVVSDGNTDSVAWSDVPAELPAVGTSENQGKVLTVNSSDAVVWGDALPSVASLDNTKTYTLLWDRGTFKWELTDTPTPPGPDYNPLNLPPYTIRIRCVDGYDASEWGGCTTNRVSESPCIWDITKVQEPENWEFLMGTSDGIIEGILEIMGANSTGVTSMNCSMMNCVDLTSVALFDTSSVTDMSYMLSGCTKVQSGALALYQHASTQATPPTDYAGAFENCGTATETGRAELAQIPADWK